MANTKKSDVSEDKVVETAITETNETKKELDINEIVKNAVQQALAESSKQYQSVINELVNKNKELEEKITDTPILTSNPINFNPNRRVKLMHMGIGSADFSRGRINVHFNEPFETREVRYDIFEEMWDIFGEWFRNFEIVILDKDVREYVNLEYGFNEYGADKNTFEEIIGMKSKECVTRIGKLKPMLAMTFLKYFVDEYVKGNPKALPKFKAITEFYDTKYGIKHINDAISESSEEFEEE